jgi:hypothetical protein
MKTKRILPVFCIFLVTLISCSKDEPVPEPNHSYTITGHAQKGPFRTGASITISELDSTLKPTGLNYYSTVYDNFGSFAVTDVELESSFVELMADGFYLNEITGVVSNERLTLKAISNIADSSVVNINVLTSLSIERIKNLVQKEGKSFKEARNQAQNEILQIFNLENTNQVGSEYLNIELPGELNSKLLAVSAIVLGDKSVASLSEFLTAFALDIKTDGTLDSKDLQQSLITSAIKSNLGDIRKNMMELYPLNQFEDFQQYVNQFINKTSFVPLETSHIYTITGLVQKGPFRTGSTITVSELNAQLKPTGLNYYSTVSDNFGSFEVPDVKLESSFVELMADGFYYHETFGIITSEKLVLKAISDLSDSSTVNVNILTHLTAERIKYLIQNNGITFAEAKRQSQNELFSVFNLKEEAETRYEYIDISKNGDLNSKLFAISMIVQGWKNVAPLTEFLTSFALDFKTDGSIDNKDIQQQLITSALFCNVGDIRKNILNLYKITEFNDFQKHVSQFVENSTFEPYLNFRFETQTSLGENLLALPDNSVLSTSKTYCLNQHLELQGMQNDFAITILETKGKGNVTYTKNDSTYWDYDTNYGSNENGTIIKGISLRAMLLDDYSDTPLLVNFSGTGEIRLTTYITDHDNLPDNGGLNVVVKYFSW